MGGGAISFEMVVIAYFHRFTTLILGSLAEIIDRADDDDDGDDGSSIAASSTGGAVSTHLGRSGGDGDGGGVSDGNGLGRHGGEEGEAISITSEDISKMGLDPWSESDRVFVEELVGFYWGRRASVRGVGVECCGVRVC